MERLKELLLYRDKICKDQTISDTLAYDILENIDNEMLSEYTLEEIESMEKELNLKKGENENA